MITTYPNPPSAAMKAKAKARRRMASESRRGPASAAARIGLTWTEYQDHINRGELWCYRDQAWHPATEFGRDRNRSTGRTASCRRSTNAAARSRYRTKPVPAPGRSLDKAARGGDHAEH